MVTVLVLFCYLPVGVLAAVMPISWIRSVERVLPLVAPLPVVFVLLAWATAGPLTSALSYGVAVIPLGISYASQVMAIVGARLAFHAGREQRPWKSLALLALLAGIPFLALAGLAVWEFARG